MSIRTIGFGILLAVSTIFAYGTANAQEQHPHCRQALFDLLSARLMLMQHIDGKPMTHNEKEALRQINVVIRDINDASVGNGTGPNNHPNPLKNESGTTTIKQCINFLRKAKDELSREEDNQFANGLRDRSIKNCDEAIKFVEQEKSSELSK